MSDCHCFVGKCGGFYCGTDDPELAVVQIAHHALTERTEADVKNFEHGILSSVKG